MRKPPHVLEIFLQPGEFFFGDENTRIRTVLGSCVSITMWHPHRRIGGMCHYVLPSRSNRAHSDLDGRYAEDAILMFLKEAVRFESDPREYVVKLFGAGNMFPGVNKVKPCHGSSCARHIEQCRNVSCRNAAYAKRMLHQLGFRISAEDLGGSASRNVVFDIWSGHVWVRQSAIEGANKVQGGAMSGARE